ncbi:hypothetical protein [Lutispora sp.]|uniref:hypothetical protein n=1 Tax=Lutispora sp. TaxID=2828727 RepID=UPI00356644F5
MEEYFLVGIIALLIVFFLSKMKRLENQFGDLLKMVGTLKFKQFEHETQLLNRSGVYIPEDSAEFVYNILWSIIDKKQKEFLENEYKQKCPAHIPIWKFVLYNYRLTTKVVQKEPLMDMSSTEKLMSNMYEIEQATKSYLKAQENIQEDIKDVLKSMKKTDTDMTEAIGEVTSKLEKIEGDVQSIK